METIQTLKSSSRAASILTFIMLALVAAIVFYIKVHFFLTGDIHAVISDVPDDTAYFYKIAWHVVRGDGFTFDGINLTNGFQPLWLYALIPLAWFFQDAPPEPYFRAALIYQATFVIIAGLLLFYALRAVTGQSIALIITALFYLLARAEFINGMETGVLMFCIAALLAYSLRYRVFSETNPRVAFGFGVLAGMLLLARLDMFFVLFVVYALAMGRALLIGKQTHTRGSLLRDIVLSAVGIALVTAPYFIYNKVVFGALMPISGQLKNSFPFVVEPEFGLARFRMRDLIAAGAAGLFTVWGITAMPRLRFHDFPHRYFFTATLAGSTATVLHYLNTALFMKWAAFDWHFAAYYFTFCLIVAAVLMQASKAFMSNRRQWLEFGAISFTLLIAAFIGMRGQPAHTSWRSVAYDAAVWVRQTTPTEAVLAMKDAGVFGLFSQRAVINLDGLVNNMGYQNALHQQRLNQYLSEKKVRYLVQHAMWDDAERNRLALSADYEFFEIRYRSRLYDTWSDPVRVYRADEVYRSEPYYDGPHKTVFLIWKLRHQLQQSEDRN